MIGTRPYRQKRLRQARLSDPTLTHLRLTTAITRLSESAHLSLSKAFRRDLHWDRLGQKNENSSCWIRVSQGWAGKNWGEIDIPRIGQEVIVDFLEGDPDRPIVTGRVYNAENPVPYALPANKTQSGIKSNSSKGGGGSNEIRFEDKKGSEQVYLHAEKDLDSLVENDETRRVGGKGTGNRTTDIKNDEKITVGGNRTETVVKNETITIGENRTEAVAKNESVAIGLTRSHAELPPIRDPRAMRDLARVLAWPSGPAGAERRRGQTARATSLP
ncbi:type VI secretion system Vgr family protein, partial [Roseomonas rosulenta]|uniref:type VI secretion system Vgr family protein n=1 Tax=Roseomonas rosulenta TaxID=2748667 RepID=UPI00272A46B3